MIVLVGRNELICFLHLSEHWLQEANVSVPTAMACPWCPCQAMSSSVSGLLTYSVAENTLKVHSF